MTKWPMVPLASVLQLQRRWIKPHPTESYREIGIRSFGNGIFHKAPIPGSALGSKRVLCIEPGDLVFNNVFAWEGAVAVAGPQEAGMIGSHRFVTYTVNPEKSTAEFLKIFFSTTNGREILLKASPGSAGRNKTLGLDRFITQSIPLPPLAEQRWIVAKIDALAAKIEAARLLRSDADKATTALSFAPYRFLPVPQDGAGEHRLGDCIESHDSGWSPQCSDVPAEDGEWAVLKTTSIQWAGFDPKQNKSLLVGIKPRPDTVVRQGDVLVTRAGPVNRVGVACHTERSFGKLMLSDKIIRLRTKPFLNPQYLAAYFATPFAQKHLRQEKTGLAESQVNISREKLLRLPVLVPTMAEQLSVQKHVQGLRRKLDDLESHHATLTKELNALLPAILDRAFKGEL